MRFEDIDRLFDPAPMALEMGFERLDSGVLHVAARTDLHLCKGEMFAWWFGSRPGPREYRWWHPIDHVDSAWAEGAPGSPIGAIHLAEERFGALPAQKLAIQFRDPVEMFDPGKLAAARGSGAVSALICGRVGPGDHPQRGPDGAMIGSRLIHLARDTPWGATLRSHFFLGQDLPGLGMGPNEIGEIFSDAFAPALLQHCYDEFTFLSRILPSLYAAEAIDRKDVPNPW